VKIAPCLGSLPSPGPQVTAAHHITLFRRQSLSLGAGGIAQGVVYLPSKCETLSSSPSTAKKSGGEEEEEEKKTTESHHLWASLLCQGGQRSTGAKSDE
jgi:hypothetical protein